MDKLVDIILAILFILLGIFLINFYHYLIKTKQNSGLSFKFRSAGIGLIIIGIVLLIKTLKNI